MKASVFFVLSFTPALVLANAIPDHTFLYERAPTPAVPEATPTGPYCVPPNGNPVPSETPPSASEIAKAVAGCQGVSPVGVTANDIVNGICKPFTLIFARGTTEQGNIGSIVGPPFVLALQNTFGASNVAVQGVNNYPATTTDYCTGGSISGSQNLAQLIQQTMKQCPKTKLCVSGYSQGAQVVHNAFEILTSNSAATNFVNSVVTYGDPDRKLPVGNVPSYKVSIVCHAGDNICQDGEIIKPEHLSYCHNVGAEAAFAKARSQAKN